MKQSLIFLLVAACVTASNSDPYAAYEDTGWGTSSKEEADCAAMVVSTREDMQKLQDQLDDLLLSLERLHPEETAAVRREATP